MSYKLVIAEKNSVAKSIAAVLNAKKRQNGFFEGNGYIVSWCVGHLLELALPEAYNEQYAKWRREDLPIIPYDWKYTSRNDKHKQLKILAELMKRIDVGTVICATDAGREGELIFRLVYEYCGCKKPVKRLWISSMEESAITKGFKTLKDGAEYDRLYQSALCRSQSDWIVGINATRLFSTLYNQALRVGRVQTPTLALLVTRENEIAAFVKEPFYTVILDCGGFTAFGEKLKDKQVADDIRVASDGKTAKINSISKQEKSSVPPKLYDLTTLQREANRLYGYTAQQTLDYVQSLYEKKLATYPRTDSRYLTEDMAVRLPTLVETLAASLTFLEGKTLSIDVRNIVDNSKVTDHHAIIPTQTMSGIDLSTLPAGERNILNMLAVRLICAVSDKHVFNETSVTVECGGGIFKAKGKSILRRGWKAVEQAFNTTLKNESKDGIGDTKDDQALPEFYEGQIFENVRANVRESFTSPPKHYTEDSLLAAMECAGSEDMPDDAERKGLGTPATRAAIIEKLVKSGFVERKKKLILPTEKGTHLITVVPEAVKSPMLTAEWENKLKQIERGEITANSFMEGISAFTGELVKTHTVPNDDFLPLFSAFGQNNGGEVIGVCPRCGGNVWEREKGFFCENQDCSFALWRNNKFFTTKKKEITKTIAAALLNEGRIFMSDLYSEKTGKTYNATIILDDIGDKKYVSFKMEFKK